MKSVLTHIAFLGLAFSACVQKPVLNTEVEKTGSKKPERSAQAAAPTSLPYLVVKKALIFKALEKPELTRRLKTGATLDSGKFDVCTIAKGAYIHLAEKMTKQLFHKRGKVTVRQYLIKIKSIDTNLMTEVASGQKLLSCSLLSGPLVGYIESSSVKINNLEDKDVAYDADLGKRYAAHGRQMGTDAAGNLEALSGDCWRDVSYAIPRAAGQPDSVFPVIRNEDGTTSNVLENGQYFLSWVKRNPNLACEIFGLELSADTSIANAPVGSTLIYNYRDKNNFDKNNNPVCTFTDVHGHIEIRVTNDGKKSLLCSDGCWPWGEGNGGVRNRCTTATAVLYPSLRCPIPASKPK